MSKSAEIRSALEVAKKHGFTPDAALEAEVANLENPQYRIAVVGKFQVGKSTLINKVFLQDNPILWEGDGICTTSVTTEVQYGPTPRMEVYRWKDAAKTEEVLDKSVDNPTAEDLKAVTVGSDRVALADTVSRVKLFSPNEGLKGYTILDTPGLDDPNPEILMNTTYRIIPGCDLAILVADAKMLDEVELDLLRNKLIAEGITKLMVMLSYRPKSDKSETMRKDILSEVKAKLGGIDRKDVPVEMYCFDESVGDILCSRAKIEGVIRDFLKNNALAGRESRVATHLRRFLDNCQVELAAKIKAAGQSNEENRRLSAEIEAKLAEIRKKNERALSEIKDIFKRNKPSEFKVRGKISPVFSKFIADLEASDLGAVKEKLESAPKILHAELVPALTEYTDEIAKDLRREVAESQRGFEAVAVEWDDFLKEKLNLGKDTLVNILVKTPTIVIELINIYGLDMILPFGFVTAIIARAFQSRVGFLKDLTLGNLVKSIILSRVRSGLDNCCDDFAKDVAAQIGDSLDGSLVSIGKQLDAQYQEQAQIITDSLAGTEKIDATAFESARAELGAAAATL